MELHEQLKKQRMNLGLTQEALSEISGVALRTLKSVESGGGNASLGLLNKLGEAMGMELNFTIKKMESLWKD